MLPNFKIMGAEKSGSTFLHKCLAEHPEVFMPDQETPFFENSAYRFIDFREFEKLFNNSDNAKAVGIKIPTYLTYPECPKRVIKHIPNAKIIVLFRNPVDRAVSAYFHQMKVGFIPVKKIEKGFRNLLKGKYNKYPRAEEIITFRYYYKHLKKYLKYFKRKIILVLYYDNLKSNPTNLIKKHILSSVLIQHVFQKVLTQYHKRVFIL
jgi:hypothetical protein